MASIDLGTFRVPNTQTALMSEGDDPALNNSLNNSNSESSQRRTAIRQQELNREKGERQGEGSELFRQLIGRIGRMRFAGGWQWRRKSSSPA